MRDCSLNIRSSVVSHAASELVTDGDTPAAHNVRVFEGNRSLLQSSDSHWNFPRRSWWIPALDGTIEQRRFRIVEQRSVFSASLARADATRKKIRIERRGGR